jgi:hypothetical protein
MMWDHVLRVTGDQVESDLLLSSIYGESIRLAGSGDHTVPLLEMTVIPPNIDEQWEPCTIQFDQFTESFDAMRASERQLRRLFHQDLPVDIGGVVMFAQYLEGDVIASPDRDGYHGRAIRFRFTPLRELYANPGGD